MHGFQEQRSKFRGYCRSIPTGAHYDRMGVYHVAMEMAGAYTPHQDSTRYTCNYNI